jgi:hypothetical protein
VGAATGMVWCRRESALQRRRPPAVSRARSNTLAGGSLVRRGRGLDWRVSWQARACGDRGSRAVIGGVSGITGSRQASTCRVCGRQLRLLAFHCAGSRSTRGCWAIMTNDRPQELTLVPRLMWALWLCWAAVLAVVAYRSFRAVSFAVVLSAATRLAGAVLLALSIGRVAERRNWARLTCIVFALISSISAVTRPTLFGNPLAFTVGGAFAIGYAAAVVLLMRRQVRGVVCANRSRCGLTIRLEPPWTSITGLPRSRRSRPSVSGQRRPVDGRF